MSVPVATNCSLLGYTSWICWIFFSMLSFDVVGRAMRPFIVHSIANICSFLVFSITSQFIIFTKKTRFTINYSELPCQLQTYNTKTGTLTVPFTVNTTGDAVESVILSFFRLFSFHLRYFCVYFRVMASCICIVYFSAFVAHFNWCVAFSARKWTFRWLASLRNNILAVLN